MPAKFFSDNVFEYGSVTNVRDRGGAAVLHIGHAAYSTRCCGEELRRHVADCRREQVGLGRAVEVTCPAADRVDLFHQEVLGIEEVTLGGDTNEVAAECYLFNAQHLLVEKIDPVSRRTCYLYSSAEPYLLSATIDYAGEVLLRSNVFEYGSVTNVQNRGATPVTNVACGLLQREIRAAGSPMPRRINGGMTPGGLSPARSVTPARPTRA